MPKITNEEIKDLKIALDVAGEFSARSTETVYLLSKIEAALDRLAKLEAAVDFKGFDEPMEDDCQIELLDIRGEIETEYNTGGGVWNTNLYVGWRYPVGDLSKCEN